MTRVPSSILLLAVLVLSSGCSKPAANHASAASTEPGIESAPATAGPLEPLTYEQERVIEALLLRKAACDRFEPGFRERSARAFERWRRYRAVEIAGIESRPGFSAQVAEMDRVAASGGGVDSELGSEALLAIFDDEGRPSDVQLSTPEGAWREFLDALSRADRARALACLSAAGREAQRTTLTSIPDDVMRETGTAFTRFDLRDGSGSSRTGTAYRKDGTAHPVVLDRAWNGDWRITSY